MAIIDPRGSRQHFPAFGLRAAGIGLLVAIAAVALIASESAGRPEAQTSATAAPSAAPLAAGLPAIAVAAGHRFNAVCGPGAVSSFGFVELDRFPLQPAAPSVPPPATTAVCVLARQGSGLWALAPTGD